MVVSCNLIRLIRNLLDDDAMENIEQMGRRGAVMQKTAPNN